MEAEPEIVELRLSSRYAQQHPWVAHGVNGFLSAYFMEQPGFRVQRHFEEPESGMHVWLCDVPSSMTMSRLLRRLRADLPPFRSTEIPATGTGCRQYVIDSAEASAGEDPPRGISP